MAENLLADHLALRWVFLYEFLQGRKGNQARRNICKVLGENYVSRKVIKYWFEKFTKKSFDLDDKPRSGRPRLDIDEDISRALKENLRAKSRELSATLKHSQTTITNHLHETGRVPKFGQLVPHDLTDSQKNCVVISLVHCSLRNERPPGLRISLLEMRNGATINADLYCTQLEKMVQAHRLYRPKGAKLLLLHDNARPHTALKTRQKLETYFTLLWKFHFDWNTSSIG